MSNIQSISLGFSATKQKAIEDAKKAQFSIVKQCADAGKEPPPYALSELIGKGSFGRVYKATGLVSGQAVAVKIISIEEGDGLEPGAADTLSDILKEVNTLKLLRNSGAKNINAVIDTLLVGHSVWMVTEYCAGGSVASLMRPTGGLPEQWIIPILREVAEAIYWVHQQGIIHRDIKCANVLITEIGGVQLCDFGVAGIIETRFDKRRTVTGTLQWMAPELFDSTVSYGMEVDIWAFGSMAYEVASGLPPNATKPIDIPRFGSYLKQNCPRLEGDQYSPELKSLVAFCMVEDPKQRPSVEKVQAHPYIYNTSAKYPAASLSRLVSAYKLWEAQGGSRQSLFSAGGAQGSQPDTPSGSDDGWVFNDDGDLGQPGLDNPADAQAVYEAYGLSSDPPAQSQPHRRRRLPPNLREFKAPLIRLFDPNTISNYKENARAVYTRPAPSDPPLSDLPLSDLSLSDLPLRDDSQDLDVRESLIDLDFSLADGEPARLTEVDTIKVRPRSTDATDTNRRTQDWTFPAFMPTSANLDKSHSESRLADMDTIKATPSSGLSDFAKRRTQDWTFPGFAPPTDLNKQYLESEDKHTALGSNRMSAQSLIDLDASVGATLVDRPSTAVSDATSTGSGSVHTPFDLESHAYGHGIFLGAREPSIYVSESVGSNREPSLYVPDGIDVYSAQTSQPSNPNATPNIPNHGSSALAAFEERKSLAWLATRLPHAPPPVSQNVMQGNGSPEEVKDELRRMISSLAEHFQTFSDVVGDLPVRRSGHHGNDGDYPRDT